MKIIVLYKVSMYFHGVKSTAHPPIRRHLDTAQISLQDNQTRQPSTFICIHVILQCLAGTENLKLVQNFFSGGSAESGDSVDSGAYGNSGESVDSGKSTNEN